MPLTEHQEERLVEWCRAHGVHASCPFCRTNDWSVGEIVAAPPHTGGASSAEQETVSMVQIICDNCRLLMLFDATPIFGKDM